MSIAAASRYGFVWVCLALATQVHGAESDTLLQQAESDCQHGLWLQAEERLLHLLTKLDATKEPQPEAETGRVRRRALFLLADVYRQLGRSAEALAKSLEFRRELRRLRGTDVRSLLRDNTLLVAADYAAMQNYPEARALLEDALSGKFGEVPLLPKLEVLVQLATIDEAASGLAAAEPRWQAARKMAAEILSKFAKNLGANEELHCHEQLLRCCDALGQDDAAAFELKVLDQFQTRLPDAPLRQRQTYSQLAAQCLARKDYRRAEQYLQRALALAPEGRESLARAQLLTRLAGVYREQNQLDRALVHSKSAAAIYEQIAALPPQSENAGLRAGALRQLREIYQQAGQFSDALRVAQRLYELQRDAWGAEDPRTVEALTALSALHHPSDPPLSK